MKLFDLIRERVDFFICHGMIEVTCQGTGQSNRYGCARTEPGSNGDGRRDLDFKIRKWGNPPEKQKVVNHGGNRMVGRKCIELSAKVYVRRVDPNPGAR